MQQVAAHLLMPSGLQAHGRQEFTPSPSETANLIKNYYSAPRTMLMRFTEDDLDETSQLTSMLQQNGHISTDLTLRTLPGNHIRPLVQNFVDLPLPVANFASNTIRSSGTVLGRQLVLLLFGTFSGASKLTSQASAGAGSLSSVAKDVGLVEIEGGLKQAGRQVSNRMVTVTILVTDWSDRCVASDATLVA